MHRSLKSAPTFWRDSGRPWTGIGAFIFIVLGTAGLLALSSCATTPAGLQHEQIWFNNTSNVVASLGAFANQLPEPAGSVFKGMVALAGAGLALWLSHIQRSVGQLHVTVNGKTAAGAKGAAEPKSSG